MPQKGKQPENKRLEDAVRRTRQHKAQHMRLKLNLNEEFGAELSSGEQQQDPLRIPAKKKNPQQKMSWLYTRSILYVIAVLAVSGILAIIIIGGALDITALNKSGRDIDVDIPVGSNTKAIAAILKDNDLISYPTLFRVVSRLEHYDGQYQSGTFTLSRDMGYEAIMEALTDNSARQTLSVMIPEGYTILQIAKLLEEKGVCSADEFYAALQLDTYDFDFLDDVPKQGEKAHRVYWLEGYLFPDTYEFYANSAGSTVVKTFLTNFDNKMDTTMRVAIKAAGLTMDEAVTLASIIQGEAANANHMYRVSRVLHNRMDDAAGFPKLQCDSTVLYATRMGLSATSATGKAYDTYECDGLPAGPINNPGMDAIKAAVFPSDESSMQSMYYFANDKKGNTYYSRTYNEHVNICRRYGIGMYASK